MALGAFGGIWLLEGTAPYEGYYVIEVDHFGVSDSMFNPATKDVSQAARFVIYDSGQPQHPGAGAVPESMDGQCGHEWSSAPGSVTEAYLRGMDEDERNAARREEEQKQRKEKKQKEKKWKK